MTDMERAAYDARFYEPVSDDAPAGKVLDDYHFFALETSTKWPTDPDFGFEDPARSPPYGSIIEAAELLLDGENGEGVRDVRPLFGLLLGQVGLAGSDGLQRALDLLHFWLREHWEDIHPGSADLTQHVERISAISGVFNVTHILRALDGLEIVPGITLHDMRVAVGEEPPPRRQEARDLNALRRSVAGNDDHQATLAATSTALGMASDHAAACDDIFKGHGIASRPALSDLAKALSERSVLVARVQEEGAETVEVEKAAASGSPTDDAVDAPSAVATSGPQRVGEDALRSRDEALAVMDGIIRYYAENAPSSPLALGVLKLRTLSDLDFNAWIKETASSGPAKVALYLSTLEENSLSGYAGVNGTETAAADERSAWTTDMRTAMEGFRETLNEQSDAVDMPAENRDALTAALDRMMAIVPDVQGEGEAVPTQFMIEDREGVKRAMERVGKFFEAEEPSSPVPAYLRRLRGLINAKFPDIVKDLVNEDGDVRIMLLETK